MAFSVNYLTMQLTPSSDSTPKIWTPTSIRDTAPPELGIANFHNNLLRLIIIIQAVVWKSVIESQCMEILTKVLPQLIWDSEGCTLSVIPNGDQCFISGHVCWFYNCKPTFRRDFERFLSKFKYSIKWRKIPVTFHEFVTDFLPWRQRCLLSPLVFWISKFSGEFCPYPCNHPLRILQEIWITT